MSAVTSLRERYPLGVVVVGLISLARVVTIAAGLLVVGDSGILAWLSKNGPLPDVPAGTDVEIVVKAALVGLLIASVLTIIGLLLRQRWAWVLAIVSAGAILAIDLGWWFAGEGRYTSMLLNAIAVFYLNQRDVRLALRGTVDG
ncbi:MAG: hypothetical protein ACJ77V_04110 [Chloroflexota bacterium]